MGEIDEELRLPEGVRPFSRDWYFRDSQGDVPSRRRAKRPHLYHLRATSAKDHVLPSTQIADIANCDVDQPLCTESRLHDSTGELRCDSIFRTCHEEEPSAITTQRRSPVLLGLGLLICLVGLPRSDAFSAIQPANGPSTGSATIFINGAGNFGLPSTPEAKARVGGTACKATLWISESSMLATLGPAGVGFQQSVTLTMVGVRVSTLSNAFTFDSPEFINLSEKSSPAKAVGSVTFVGTGFGAYTSSPQLRLGDTACVNTRWTSSSTILCKVPSGTASGTASQGSMVLTMAAYIITRGMALTYDAPKILGVRGRKGQLANGPATGGTTISVSGENFGPWDASASSYIGDTKAMSMWASDSSITVVVGPGFGIEQSVTIDLQQVSSDVFTKAYYFDGPVITGLLQANGPATGGSTLSVLGLNFGTQNYSPEIHIGSQDPCLQPTWTSDSLIACTVPSKKGGSKDVVVTWPPDYIIQPSTLSNSFTYDLPVVTNIESTNGPAVGKTDITIQGKNFGASEDMKVQASILSQVGEKLCFLTTWTSDSQLTCNTPVGVGGDSSIKVNFASAPEAFGTLSLAFTFDSPVVLFNDALPFTLNVPAGNSAVITIQGENFGANDYSPKAAIGDSLCINTKWKSDTSLLCTVAMGILDSYSIVVSLQAQVGTYKMAVSYDRPAITSMARNGPKSGGSSLTLYGKNFGSSGYTQGVQIGDTKIDISNVQWTSDSSMVALLPPGRGVNLDVIVFQSDSVELPLSDSPRDRRGSGMLTGAFTFDSPGISSVKRSNGPQSGEYSITISGSSFGSSEPSSTLGDFQFLSISVGSTECKQKTWQSDSSLACALAAGYGKADVTVTLYPTDDSCTSSTGPSACQATMKTGFIYDGPNPSALLGAMNGPSSGGQVITVIGTSFGLSDPGEALVAFVGDTKCQVTTWVDPTSLTCMLGPGLGTRDVMVNLANVTKGITRSFSYDAANVTSFTPTTLEGPQAGGVQISVYGQNFGFQAGLGPIGVMIDGLDCPVSKWISSTSVVVSTPAGVKRPAGNFLMFGVPGSPEDQLSKIAPFNYYYPNITGLNPSLISGLGGGIRVSVSGNNFGGMDSTPSIFIGKEQNKCVSSTWVSDSSLVCTMPASSAGKQTIWYLSGAKGNLTSDLVSELKLGNSVDGSTSAAFAASVKDLVEFLDVPEGLLVPPVVIQISAADCSKSKTIDVGMDVTMNLEPGWCNSGNVSSGSSVLLMVSSSKYAPSAGKDAVAASKVLIGLTFRGLSPSGPVAVKVPLNIERRLDTKLVRQAWLNQCTGNWVPLCSSTATADSISSSLPPDVAIDPCYDVSNKATCAKSVIDAKACGAGGKILALAYTTEPCPPPAAGSSNLGGIIIGACLGGVAFLLASVFACLYFKSKAQKQEDRSINESDLESDDDWSVDADFVYGKTLPMTSLPDDVTFVPVSHMFPASGFPNTMPNLDNSFDNLFSSNMAVNTQTFGGRGDVGMPGSMFDSVPAAYTGMQATTYTGREIVNSGYVPPMNTMMFPSLQGSAGPMVPGMGQQVYRQL